MEVAIVLTVFGHYHLARLRACQGWTDKSVVGVEVVGGKGITGIARWRATQGRETVRIRKIFEVRDYCEWRAKDILRGVSQTLSMLRPAVAVVPGWSDYSALAALYWCQRNRVPAVMLSETTEHDEPRVFWKEAVKRRVVRMCGAALTGGSQHAAYLRKLGLSPHSVLTGYDVVDNDHFSSGLRGEGRLQRGQKGKQGVMDHYFLASARFVVKKNLLRLLEAYARYRQMASTAEKMEHGH